jgi:gluconokinase
MEDVAMILVLESSTSSAKAMLFDAAAGGGTGRVVKVLSEAYPNEVCHAGETGVQDTAAIFRQTARLGRQLCASYRAESGGSDIEAVVPCGTFHSIVVCDAGMTPLTPTYTWTYTGARQTVAERRQDAAYVRHFYQRSGCMVHALYPFFQLLHLRDSGLSLKNTRIASQSAYMFYQLTGERRESACTGSGAGLVNIHTRDWDAETLAEAGIEASQLGRAADYRDTAPLDSAGAELLGLKTGIPVLPAHPDGALNQVGAGALVEGVMTFSVGTSAALRLSAAKPVVPETPSTWCYLSPEAWMSGAATSGACNCVDWIKTILFPAVSYA